MSALSDKFGSPGGDSGCSLPTHYPELQALCDALGHAAQLEMAEAIERGDDVSRERAYGKWLGARGILRAPSFGDVAHVQQDGGLAGVINAAGTDFDRHLPAIRRATETFGGVEFAPHEFLKIPKSREFPAGDQTGSAQK